MVGASREGCGPGVMPWAALSAPRPSTPHRPTEGILTMPKPLHGVATLGDALTAAKTAAETDSRLRPEDRHTLLLLASYWPNIRPGAQRLASRVSLNWATSPRHSRRAKGSRLKRRWCARSARRRRAASIPGTGRTSSRAAGGPVGESQGGAFGELRLQARDLRDGVRQGRRSARRRGRRRTSHGWRRRVGR